ncbi:MAG: ABC transporter substrate-binding protein, partial [Solirubrobacterales bacterium]
MNRTGWKLSHTWMRRVLLPALALTLTLGLAACGSDDDGDDGGSSGGGKKIALLLPETKTARYESQDKPLFEQNV